MIGKFCVALCLMSSALPAAATEMKAGDMIQRGREKKLKGDFEGAARDAYGGFELDHSRIDGIYNYVCYLDLQKALPENVWYGVYQVYDAVAGSPLDKEKYLKLLREDPDLKRFRTLREFKWSEQLFAKGQGPFHVLAAALSKAMKMDVHYRVLEEMGLDDGSGGVDIKTPSKYPWLRVVMDGWNDKKDRSVKFRLNLKTSAIEKLSAAQVKLLKELFTEHFKLRSAFFTSIAGQKVQLPHSRGFEAIEQVAKLKNNKKAPTLRPEEVTRDGNHWSAVWDCCAKDPMIFTFDVDVWTGRVNYSSAYHEAD